MYSLSSKISDFSKENVQEVFEYDNNLLWSESHFYDEIDESRRKILGLFLEIKQANGSWKFMDNVVPSLFKELHEILEETLAIIKRNIENIHYNIWIDDSLWDYPSNYKIQQNEESQYYYLLEYLISKLKKDFIDKKPLSHHFSHASYSKKLRKIKIRTLNVFYYFHEISIQKCKNKAKQIFINKLLARLGELSLPYLAHKDFFLHDLDLGFCKDKLKELFKLDIGNEEYKIGLEPLWKEEEETNYFLHVFNHVDNDLFLLSNNRSLSQAIRDSGEFELFLEWFNEESIREAIIKFFYNRLYYRYLEKETLTPEDLKSAKNAITAKQNEIYESFGVKYSLAEITKVFRDYQIFLIDNSEEDYKAHSYQILNSIFPQIEEETEHQDNTQNEDLEPNEILVIDLETTGTNYLFDSIIEIGICKLNLITGEIEPVFNQICREYDKKIDYNAWIFDHSDLDYNIIYNAPNFNELRKKIQHLLNTYYITSYNQSFDFNFLESRGLKIRKRFWDPSKDCKYRMQIPWYEDDFKIPSVEESYLFLFPDSDIKVKHRALDDAIIEAKIIFEINKLEKKEVNE